jgi:hypothetical protein
MNNLFGDPESPAKSKKEPKPPFDLDAKLKEINLRPKKSPLLPDFIPSVPWHGKSYRTIAEEGGLQMVKDHIEKMELDAARAYRLYLINFYDFPRSWRQDLAEE